MGSHGGGRCFIDPSSLRDARLGDLQKRHAGYWTRPQHHGKLHFQLQGQNQKKKETGRMILDVPLCGSHHQTAELIFPPKPISLHCYLDLRSLVHKQTQRNLIRKRSCLDIIFVGLMNTKYDSSSLQCLFRSTRAEI